MKVKNHPENSRKDGNFINKSKIGKNSLIITRFEKCFSDYEIVAKIALFALTLGWTGIFVFYSR